ncbi:MAG: adenylate kinase [Clostridia bacterium]|nr:adenylate kinase [Clostridia bacterium]
MIFLIGGSSHVGKTYMAQKLLEKYKFPYVSLDHLKMGFIRTGKTELTVEDDYEMRYFLWPFAAEMIKTAIENKQNMIVEGCYIPGEWKKSFSQEYLKEIRCAFIVMSETYLRENVAAVADNASVIEQRLDDEIDLERLIMCSKNFKNDAIENDFPYIEIDGEYDENDLLNRLVSIMES